MRGFCRRRSRGAESALAGRDYLEGEFSLADIAYVPHSFMLHEGGFDFGEWPNVERWLLRLFERPAWAGARAGLW